MTASRSDVLKGKTAITSDSNDEIVAGTMADRRTPDSSIGGFNTTHPNIGLHKAFYPQATKPLNQSESWFTMSPPEGYYTSPGGSYVGLPFSEMAAAVGVNSSKMLSGLTILGVEGRIPNKSNADYYAGDADLHNSTVRLWIKDSGYYIGTVNESGNATGTGAGIMITYADLRKLLGLTANDLKTNKQVLGLTGTFTNDAVLDPQWLVEGQCGYDDGVKKWGTMKKYTVADASDMYWWNNYLRVRFPGGCHVNHDGSGAEISMVNTTAASKLGITPGKIIKGQSIGPVAGTVSVQSAISFSTAVLSETSIRVQWTNPTKGPWQGVFIQMSTSSYPGTGGGSRVYTGAGNNPNQAGGYNYVDISGLSAGTTYYFTCTSYVNNLGWGSSFNISVVTKHTLETVIREMRPSGGDYTLFNTRSNSYVHPSAIKCSGDIFAEYPYLQTTSGNTLYSSYLWTTDIYVPATPVNGVTKSCLFLQDQNESSAREHANILKTLYKSVHIDSTGYNELDLVDHYDFRIIDITYTSLGSNIVNLPRDRQGHYVKIIFDCNRSNYVQMRVLRMIFNS